MIALANQNTSQGTKKMQLARIAGKCSYIIPYIVHSTISQKKDENFVNQTSWYWVEYKFPLSVTEDNIFSRSALEMSINKV